MQARLTEPHTQYDLYLKSGAEAVFVISNPKLTRKVVYGMESRGVPGVSSLFVFDEWRVMLTLGCDSSDLFGIHEYFFRNERKFIIFQDVLLRQQPDPTCVNMYVE